MLGGYIHLVSEALGARIEPGRTAVGKFPALRQLPPAGKPSEGKRGISSEKRKRKRSGRERTRMEKRMAERKRGGRTCLWVCVWVFCHEAVRGA